MQGPAAGALSACPTTPGPWAPPASSAPHRPRRRRHCAAQPQPSATGPHPGPLPPTLWQQTMGHAPASDDGTGFRRRFLTVSSTAPRYFFPGHCAASVCCPSPAGRPMPQMAWRGWPRPSAWSRELGQIRILGELQRAALEHRLPAPRIPFLGVENPHLPAQPAGPHGVPFGVDRLGGGVVAEVQGRAVHEVLLRVREALAIGVGEGRRKLDRQALGPLLGFCPQKKRNS